MQDNSGNTPFVYKPGGENSVPAEPVVPRPRQAGAVTWTASEYIEHEHGGGWYFGLTLATAALAAAAFFLSGRDYFAAGVIAVVGIIVGVAASRKPRVIQYELTDSGIQAGDKLYPYKNYKSFGLISEGSISSLSLQPLKRLAPPLAVYLPTRDSQKIVDALGQYLPYEERKPDSVDRLARRLRF